MLSIMPAYCLIAKSNVIPMARRESADGLMDRMLQLHRIVKIPQSGQLVFFSLSDRRFKEALLGCFRLIIPLDSFGSRCRFAYNPWTKITFPTPSLGAVCVASL
jgi:hypothetical protein